MKNPWCLSAATFAASSKLFTRAVSCSKASQNRSCEVPRASQRDNHKTRPESLDQALPHFQIQQLPVPSQVHQQKLKDSQPATTLTLHCMLVRKMMKFDSSRIPIESTKMVQPQNLSTIQDWGNKAGRGGGTERRPSQTEGNPKLFVEGLTKNSLLNHRICWSLLAQSITFTESDRLG